MDTKMSDKVRKSVITAIAKQKHIEPDSVAGNSLLDELGINSLDAITIVFDVEEEFDIEVPGDVLEGLESVQDIVDGISKLVNAG